MYEASQSPHPPSTRGRPERWRDAALRWHGRLTRLVATGQRDNARDIFSCQSSGGYALGPRDGRTALV